MFGSAVTGGQAILDLDIEPRIVLWIEIDEEEVAAHFRETRPVVAEILPRKFAGSLSVSREHIRKAGGATLGNLFRLNLFNAFLDCFWSAEILQKTPVNGFEGRLQPSGALCQTPHSCHCSASNCLTSPIVHKDTQLCPKRRVMSIAGCSLNSAA